MSSLLMALTAAATTVSMPLADSLPPPDPATYYRVMTAEGAGSTSKCIGQTDDPVCALETALACSVRGDAKLCAQAVAPGAPAADWRPRPGQPARYRLDKATMLGYPPKLFPAAKVGDLVLKVSSIEPAGAARVYYLGKRDGVWRVFGWEPAKTAGP
jgi:hypothetical protein